MPTDLTAVCVALDPAELATLRAQAEARGLTVATLARYMIVRALEAERVEVAEMPSTRATIAQDER